MIKIFSSNKIVILTNKELNLQPKENSMIAKIESQEEMKLVYDELIGKKNLHEIYLYHPDLEKLFSFFCSMFTLVEAAGGLVKNSKNQYLFIFRHGKWDLPKGKLEREESIAAAGIREVMEECGIRELEIIRQLPTTYHTYSLKGKEILKPSYWFEMVTSDEGELVPQLEEGITEAKWLNAAQIDMVKANTFPSIFELIRSIGL